MDPRNLIKSSKPATKNNISLYLPESKKIRGNFLYALVHGTDWFTAQNNARAIGGNLAVIDDIGENEFLYESYRLTRQKFTGLWIGISDQDVEGKWINIFGQQIAFSNWNAGEPNNAKNSLYPSLEGNEDFGIMLLTQKGCWNDVAQSFKTKSSLVQFGIAKIPILSSIKFNKSPREGAGIFQAIISISTLKSADLLDNIYIYWRLSGITADDLETGSINGVGKLEQGIFKISQSLKLDTDYGETLGINLYADTSMTMLIGSSGNTLILENRKPRNFTLKAFRFREYSSPGTVVGVFNAEDPDNDFISRYELDKSNSLFDVDNNLFEIFEDELKLKEGAFINHAQQSSVSVRARAYDSGTPSQFLTSIFTIQVEDVIESSVQLLNATIIDNTLSLEYTGQIYLYRGNDSASCFSLIQNDSESIPISLNSDQFYRQSRNMPTNKLLIPLPEIDLEIFRKIGFSYEYFSDRPNRLQLKDGNSYPIAPVSNFSIDTYISTQNFSENKLPKAFVNLILSGSAAINGSGNDSNNKITGNSYNNVLDGGIGEDKLLGGIGNDIYIIDNTKDEIIEFTAEGQDKAISSVSYILPQNVESIELKGRMARNAGGNILNNILTGNSEANIFYGDLGDDRLEGQEGNDTADYRSIDVKLDVNLQTGLCSGLGNDLLLSIENFISGSGNDYLIGNIKDNIISGGNGDDFLLGGDGEDSLKGEAGNDTIAADKGNDIISGGEGIDTYDCSNASSSIYVSLVSGISNGVGDDKISELENITGGNFNDIIIGDSQSNSITGENGNDLLIGGMSGDVLRGGSGYDEFAYNSFKESNLQTFDHIVDFNVTQDSISGFRKMANLKNKVFNLGVLNSLDQRSIQVNFDAFEFHENTAGIAKLNDHAIPRTFLIVNDRKSEFSQDGDFILELTGFTGDIMNIRIY